MTERRQTTDIAPDVTIEQIQELLAQYDVAWTQVKANGPHRYDIDGPNAVYTGYVCEATVAVWRIHVTDVISRNGFRRIPRCLLNHYHEKWTPLADRWVFYLTDGFQGPPLCTTVADASRVGAALARLHLASATVWPQWPNGVPLVPPAHYGHLTRQIRRQYEAILAERMLAAKQSTEWDDTTWRAWLDTWAELGRRAASAGSIDVLAGIERDAQLAHEVSLYCRSCRDFVDLGAQRIGILCRATPQLDSHAADVVALCAEHILLGHVDAAEALFAAYTAVQPLSPITQGVLRACIGFPFIAARAIAWRRANGRAHAGAPPWLRSAEASLAAARRWLGD